MTGFLLDTNIPSELTRRAPDPRVETWVHSADRPTLYISVITLGEIRKGLTILGATRRRQQLEEWFATDLKAWFEERVLPVTEAISERWGLLDGERHLQGRPLNTADGLIAATALEHDLSLVTRNVSDYESLGVTIVNPWES